MGLAPIRRLLVSVRTYRRLYAHAYTRGSSIRAAIMEPLLKKARFVLGARGAIIREATRAARSPHPDQIALETLAPLLWKHRFAARRALAIVEPTRTHFENDLAFRLLDSALSGTPLAAPPPDRRALFDRERRLGHLPLVDAFGFLSTRDHRLQEIADSLQSGAISLEGDLRDQKMRIKALVPRPIGPGDQLCESDLATTIAVQYLLILSGALPGDPTNSYFALPRKLRIRTFRLGAPDN